MNRRTILITAGAAALTLFVMWLIWRPSLGDLEGKAEQAGDTREAAQIKAEAEAVRARERMEAAPKPADDSVFRAQVAQFEALILQQNAYIDRKMASLETRTQARSQAVQALATTGTPELNARVVALVGEPLAGTDTALRSVIRIGIDRDQARDEAAASKDVIASKDEQLRLKDQLRAETQARLDDTKAYAETIKTMAGEQQAAFERSLTEIRTTTRGELDAKDAVIKRLKGNSFLRAIKTGTQIGAGIGIGIVIGKTIN